MNYLVIDLEMCNVPRDYRSRSYKYANETIQIGAVLLDEEFKRIGTLSQYVHPEHGVIDPFIQNLTGIRNSQVKKAPRIEEALLHMIDWIGDREYKVYAWSGSDRAQLLHEIKAKKICDERILDFVCEARWIDYQDVFVKRFGIERKIGLEEALGRVEIEPEGRLHDGLDDAVNTGCDICEVEADHTIRMQLLDWFSDLGISFCYSDSHQLANYMVLRPDWITNAIYIILFNGVNGLCDKDSSAIVDMLFDLPDFGQMSSDGYELYEEIAAHLLAVYFDAYKNIEIRRKCEVTLLAIEDKISHICELEVRNNLCKMMFLTLGKIHMHDWNELHTEYSYKDKMFLNEIWSKYGWLHFKNLLYVINQMHITELLPEIILPLNESLRKCGENYADCKEMIKANAVIINKIITKAFLDFNDDIKCDHELVKAFEEVLETLVGFGMEEAAVILDEFRVH